MMKYVQVKDIAAAFKIPDHRLIDYLKRIRLYNGFPFSYDSYISFSDTIHIFEKTNPNVNWHIAKKRLLAAVIMIDKDFYSVEKTIKAKDAKSHQRKSKRATHPSVPKTAEEVALQRRLPNSFMTGGLTQ